MTDRWESYRRRADGQLVSSYVNLGIRDSAPDPDKPILVRITVLLRIRRDNGQAHQDESPKLLAIEKSLGEALTNSIGATFVGRVTTRGRREFYSYAGGNEGLSECVTQVMADFPEYKYEIASGRNPSWDYYLNVLFPYPVQLQAIQNRTVLQSLAESGDNSDVPRPIEHFSYFKSASDRDQFLKAAVGLGFTLRLNGLSEGEDADFPLGAVYYRMDKPQLDVIDQTTMKLDDLTRAYRGKYDGWETEIVLKEKQDVS